MIAVIHVKLRGKGIDLGGLIRLGPAVVPQRAPNTGKPTPGIKSYTKEMAELSVHTGVPNPGARAMFIWNNQHTFEVVLETFHNGNLLKSSEIVVLALQRYLRSAKEDFQIHLELRAPLDAQTYLRGQPNSPWSRLWEELQGDIRLLLIAIVLVVIAKLWLDQYFQESIAVAIGVLLSTVSKAPPIYTSARKRGLHWRINEVD